MEKFKEITLNSTLLDVRKILEENNLPCLFPLIDIDSRKIIIEILIKNRIYLSYDDDTPNLRQLLLTIKSNNDEKAVLDLLEKDNNKLLNELYNTVSSGLYSTDFEINELLASWIVKHRTPSVESLISNGSFVRLFAPNQTDYASVSMLMKSEYNREDGTVNFTPCFIGSSMDFGGSSNSCDYFGLGEKTTRNLNEWILITFDAGYEGYDYIKGFNSTEIDGRTLYIVPAIFAHTIFEPKYKEYIENRKAVIQSVFFLFLSISEFQTAYEVGNKLYLTLATLDVLAASNQFVLDVAVKSILEETEDGQQFIDSWQKVINIYGLTRLTTALILPNDIIKLRNNIDKVKGNPSLMQDAKVKSTIDNADEICLRLELKVAGGTYLENLAYYKQLFQNGKYTELFTELKKTTAFPKMGKTRNISYDDLLSEYISSPGALPNHCPYMQGRIATNFELEEIGYFVRMYDGSGSRMAGKWIFRIEDLRAYKNIDELVEKLALPNRPTKIALVEVPASTTLRKSIVGQQEWVQGKVLQGGGTQYELMNNIDGNQFQELFNNVDDFFK